MHACRYVGKSVALASATNTRGAAAGTASSFAAKSFWAQPRDWWRYARREGGEGVADGAGRTIGAPVDTGVLRAGGPSPRPASIAHLATCERDLNPSLFRMCLTCTSAVAAVITSSLAISRLVRPAASRAATSCSRAVRFADLAGTRDAFNGAARLSARSSAGCIFIS